MPASAKHTAIPAPMVPKPTTAARWIAFTGVFRLTSGTFAASRSAKKRWRWALDCSDSRHSTNNSRSRARAESNGMEREFPTLSRQRAGAITPRARRRKRDLAASINESASAGRGTLREDTRRGVLPLRARSSANVTAASIRSLSASRSTSPSSHARSAFTASPLKIISSANSRPTRRGRRWVPPAPGISPSLISGSPRRASLAATR